MGVPFHRVRACGGILVAARGASVHTFRLDDGAHIAVWRVPGAEEADDDPSEHNGAAGPPTKKRKLEVGAERDPEAETEAQPEAEAAASGEKDTDAPAALTKSQKKRNARRKTIPQPKVDGGGTDASETATAGLSTLALRSADLSVVSILEAAPDGRHVVVVLGHDKTVRVLAHDQQGHLEQLSARVMPKRPCAVAWTTDGQTILCGDKFGDVYALSLLEKKEGGFSSETTDEPPAEAAAASSPLPAADPAGSAATPLQLRANHLTVHTKGNLQALENQRRQKELQQQQQQKQQQSKKEPDAHNQLLLGHVSMLTAVAVAEATDAARPGCPRPLILTADRDEHIRVTRGVIGPSPATSQTHVIETFCLGHTSFVSRLCVLPGSSNNGLLSGGGDGTLRLWEYWPEGRQVGEAALAPVVTAVATAATASDAPASSTPAKLAISGIWAVAVGGSSGAAPSWQIVVICERIPALFFFALTPDGCSLAHAQTLALPASRLPLDAALVPGAQNRLLVATMTSGSAEEASGSSASSLLQLQYNGQWTVVDTVGAAFVTPETAADEADLPPTVAVAALRQQLLYSTESLRKDNEEGGESQ